MRCKNICLIVMIFTIIFVAPSFEVTAQETDIILEVVATITLDKEPLCIAINEETNRVYVGVNKGIMVLNGETDEVLEEISIDPPLEDITIYPIDYLAINPRTNRIFVPTGGCIRIIDGITKQEVGRIPHYDDNVNVDSIYSYEFALNPSTNLVYLAEETMYKERYDRVHVFDAETCRLVTTINVPGSYEHQYWEHIGVAVNPKTSLVYVMWSNDNKVYAIDGNTHEIIKSMEHCYSMYPGFSMVNTLINPYTNYVYFISPFHKVHESVCHGETLEDLHIYYPGELRAINAQDNLLYTIESEELYLLEGSSHETLASLELGWRDRGEVGMYEVAVNSQTDKVYLGDRSEKEISVVQRTLSIPEESDDNELPQNWYLVVLVVAAFLVPLFYYVMKKWRKT